MEGKVVAVVNSLDEKNNMIQELKSKGIRDMDISTIFKTDKEAVTLSKYFQDGEYVIIVTENEDLFAQEDDVEAERIEENSTPTNHHHLPHHQMKHGL